ncbi:type 1 glutamine amidotransferase domain-containing protein [Thermomonospora catenispora]|uniref:type 1 glutamine amidotransferase domain-containing protein n=1 Tax=Thermomonospora catenispora TaxID=2493090 RepID=UPI00112236CF|nr:type 1 glutamine amidotransferase domain-containing protein [Thermomonospora catenispora]TNY37592.1 type 1 glutamine amidotransferase domain-containing protein [Thermomonospora catenispora]
MARILFVMTGARHWTLNDGTRHPTGFWAEEAVTPYRAVTEAGHRVTVASPGGVVPEPDEASLSPDAGGGEEGAEEIAAALREFTELRSPLPLAEADPADYDAVFYPGGHGPMEDLAADADSGRLLTATLDAGKPLGLLCHGPAALLAARRPNGGSPFAGYRLTGFTNEEERQAGFADKAPWLLEDRLIGLGADFRGGEPWKPNVVVDRNLFTGQNPASTEPLIAKLLAALG